MSEVPDALERLIRSWVDRLRPLARDAILAASVLGGEFSLSALRAVTAANGELPGVLGELCATGLLREVGQIPALFTGSATLYPGNDLQRLAAKRTPPLTPVPPGG